MDTATSHNSDSRRQGFSHQAAWLFGSQVLIVLCAAIYSAVTARVLGPSAKGILTLAITIPGSLVFAFSLGLDISCTYFISSGRTPASRVASAAMLYSLVAGAALLAVLALLARWMHVSFFHGQIGIVSLLIAFTALPVGLAVVMLTGVLLGLQKIRELSLARVIGSLITAALTLALWAVGGLTIFRSILLAILATSLTGALAYRTLRASGVKMNLSPDAGLFLRELRHGLKAHFGNLAQWANYRMDILLIGLLLRPVEVGLYAAAVSLAELVLHLPNTLAQLLFPHVAKLSGARANRLTVSVCKWTIPATLLALIGAWTLGPTLIRIVLGHQYAMSTPALRLLLPGVLALSVSKILTGDLNGRGKPEYGAYSSYVALPITVIGNLILIPRMGIAGAALTSSVSYITGACIVAVLFFRECRKSSRGPSPWPRKDEQEPARAFIPESAVCVEEAV